MSGRLSGDAGGSGETARVGARQRELPHAGRVLCITGVAGAGKSTLVAALHHRHPDLLFSVSATTRAQRPGEVDGVDYDFVSDAAFDRLIAEGDLIEWVWIYGHRSGTRKTAIDNGLAAGRDVLLDIDPRGARFVKATYPNSRTVFLVPPDETTQRERLVARGTTGPDLDRRLREAAEMRSFAAEFDAVVVNDRVEDAIEQVDDILFPSSS